MKFMPNRKRITEDERGLTLIEILGALTIMSIITVLLLGNLISSMETSADQSRRLIAMNLARLKIAEIRETYEEGAKFDELRAEFSTRGTELIRLDANNTLQDLDLDDEEINNTYYKYEVELDIRTNPQKTKLDQVIGDSSSYLIPMRVTVFWGYTQEGGSTESRYSVTIPSYVVKLGG